MTLIYLSNRGSLALNNRGKYLLLQLHCFEEISIEVLMYCCHVDTCILRCMAVMQKLDIIWTNKLINYLVEWRVISSTRTCKNIFCFYISLTSVSVQFHLNPSQKPISNGQINYLVEWRVISST